MTPFEETLKLISIAANANLNSNYSKIIVQGCNKPNNIQLVFTIFDKKHNYQMEFCSVKNFRLYRADGDPAVEEQHIKNYLKMFDATLNKYL